MKFVELLNKSTCFEVLMVNVWLVVCTSHV